MLVSPLSNFPIPIAGTTADVPVIKDTTDHAWTILDEGPEPDLVVKGGTRRRVTQQHLRRRAYLRSSL